MGLDSEEVVRFERRLTETLEIQEDVQRREHEDVLEEKRIKGMRSRLVMMGLATLGKFFSPLLSLFSLPSYFVVILAVAVADKGIKEEDL